VLIIIFSLKVYEKLNSTPLRAGQRGLANLLKEKFSIKNWR